MKVIVRGNRIIVEGDELTADQKLELVRELESKRPAIEQRMFESIMGVAEKRGTVKESS